MKKYMLFSVLVMASAALLLAGCEKPGVVEEPPEQPAPRTEVPTPPSMPPEGSPAAPAPQRAIIDEEVASKWIAVEITVTEKKEGGESFILEIPLGGEADVEGTPLKVQLLGFVPDFAMGAEAITTKSLEDNNPAAKLEVHEGEEVLFSGWSFRDFPEMHSFDDPRYTVQLTGAISKE